VSALSGVVDTMMAGERRPASMAAHPGRLPRPSDEVKEAQRFLALPHLQRFVTGAMLAVDGGLTTARWIAVR
jgi:NAD(P)-dependent dehydrogenase (short-subunit alcohol dehydrogenase family)